MLIEIAFGLAVTFAVPSYPSGPGLQADLVPVDFILPVRRVVSYPPTGELHMLSMLPMLPDAQAAFDTEFASATYYSAFALSKDGGWGYSRTTNSLGAARAIAMQECLSMNAQCLIIAEIRPQGYVAPGPGDITVTPEVAGYLDEFMGEPGFRAFAVSADGAYASLWNVATQAEADALALSDCESYRTSHLPGLMDMPCVLLPQPK